MILNFHIIFDRIPLSKQNSPEWDASFCGITSGYICLPMFHTENAKQSERISDSSKKRNSHLAGFLTQKVHSRIKKKQKTTISLVVTECHSQQFSVMTRRAKASLVYSGQLKMSCSMTIHDLGIK